MMIKHMPINERVVNHSRIRTVKPRHYVAILICQMKKHVKCVSLLQCGNVANNNNSYDKQVAHNTK